MTPEIDTDNGPSETFQSLGRALWDAIKALEKPDAPREVLFPVVQGRAGKNVTVSVTYMIRPQPTALEEQADEVQRLRRQVDTLIRVLGDRL